MIVDLTQHLNKDVRYGNADFPISLKPIAYRASDGVPGDRDTYTYEDIQNKYAVVWEDNGLPLPAQGSHDRTLTFEH